MGDLFPVHLCYSVATRALANPRSCFRLQHHSRLLAPVLYVSGEESVQQIKLRADRLEVNADKLFVLSETDLDRILAAAEKMNPGLLIVDSIQTVYADEITSAAGSVSQVRECTARLIQWAKPRQIPVLIVGHVTKEGTIAGPRVLEHMVDAVLYLKETAITSTAESCAR